MSFAPVEKTVETGTTWNVKCIECSKVVGQIEAEEMLSFLEYLTTTREAVLCFDCEAEQLKDKYLKACARPIYEQHYCEFCDRKTQWEYTETPEQITLKCVNCEDMLIQI